MNKCNACGNEQEAVGVCTKCGAPVEAAVSKEEVATETPVEESAM